MKKILFVALLLLTTSLVFADDDTADTTETEDGEKEEKKSMLVSAYNEAGFETFKDWFNALWDIRSLKDKAWKGPK